MKPIPDGFRGLAMPLHEDSYNEVSRLFNVPVALIKTVAKVETHGSGFDTQARPKMLFERHWFRKFTNGQYDNTHPDISNIKPGGYTVKEYERMDRALTLDLPAALKSASWGMFQIMGFNHSACGYITPVEFVADMCQSEELQLRAFMRFIGSKGLIPVLKAKDWRSFAKAYNGPAYEKNDYHTKLADAYVRYS